MRIGLQLGIGCIMTGEDWLTAWYWLYHDWGGFALLPGIACTTTGEDWLYSLVLVVP